MALKFTPKDESEISRFSNLPDGDYPFTVLESDIKTSKSAKNAGKEMCALKLNVHGPDFDRHVYDYFADWFSEWKLKHFCETTRKAKEYESGVVDPASNSWAGRTGFVRLKITHDPKYGDKNEVDDYLPPAPVTIPATKPAPLPSEGESDDVPF
jgi:hypothetical protein